LPIGNLTSQHWANVYLNELDQYAKQVLKCRAYLRYVDDMVLFSDQKEQMNQWRAEIIQYAQTLRLTLHEEFAQPRPSHTGVSFLGFQIFPDHRRLKPANGYAFQRRLKNMHSLYQSGEISQQDLMTSVQSWINHVRYGDTWGLRRAVLSAAGVYGA